MEDLKNIGDAGDSTPTHDESDEFEINQDRSFFVVEMAHGIKTALQCGDHSNLQTKLAKLNIWRTSPKTTVKHNYWRVAQYVGETELTNISVLLTVTCEKSDSIKWTYLDDALGALSLCLSNREVIFKLQAYSNSLIPILVSALDQDMNESVSLHSLSIITVVVIVCRARFARGLINGNFLDKMVDRLAEQGPITSLVLFKKILEVVKSLLMCGQAYILSYSKEILNKLLNIVNALSSSTENQACLDIIDFYFELVRSTEGEEKAHICAKYWTKGKLRKELLSEYLGQSWLYVYCSWPACGCLNNSTNAFFRKCGACNMVRYCSRSCQEKHWVNGHFSQCKRMPVSSKDTQSSE